MVSILILPLSLFINPMKMKSPADSSKYHASILQILHRKSDHGFLREFYRPEIYFDDKMKLNPTPCISTIDQ